MGLCLNKLSITFESFDIFISRIYNLGKKLTKHLKQTRELFADELASDIACFLNSGINIVMASKSYTLLSIHWIRTSIGANNVSTFVWFVLHNVVAFLLLVKKSDNFLHLPASWFNIFSILASLLLAHSILFYANLNKQRKGGKHVNF